MSFVALWVFRGRKILPDQWLPNRGPLVALKSSRSGHQSCHGFLITDPPAHVYMYYENT